MNKEMLEKMAYLNEAGFEPSSYYDVEGWHGRNFVEKDYAETELSRLINDPKELTPWFSESRLWGLLPKRINKDYVLEEIENKGLHDALLDVIVYAVKEGYPKIWLRQ